MATEVGICNAALAKVGRNRITSLIEDSPAAILCAEMYPRLRDALLRNHYWRFNTKRVRLVQSATAPDFGWEYQYLLPSDWARTVAVYDNPGAERPLLDYRHEGGYILADAAELYLVYNALITNAGEFGTMFSEVLSMFIASELALSLTKSSTTSERLLDRAEGMLADAESADDQDDPPEDFAIDTWDSVRG